MPPNHPGCLSGLSAKLPTRCSPKLKALAHLKVAMWPSGQVWTSDPMVLCNGPSWVTPFLWTLPCEMAVMPQGGQYSHRVCVRFRGDIFAKFNSNNPRKIRTAVMSQAMLAFLTRFCLPVTFIFKTMISHTLLPPLLHPENPFTYF